MRTVYKYEFRLNTTLDLQLPAGARVVEFATQAHGPGVSVPCVWIELDTDAEKDQTRRFELVGTGHPVLPLAMHMGTAHAPEMGLVVHLYERHDHGHQPVDPDPTGESRFCPVCGKYQRTCPHDHCTVCGADT
jgi:hypothetical protein